MYFIYNVRQPGSSQYLKKKQKNFKTVKNCLSCTCVQNYIFNQSLQASLFPLKSCTMSYNELFLNAAYLDSGMWSAPLYGHTDFVQPLEAVMEVILTFLSRIERQIVNKA